ncbi:MAG: hypothetical protein OER90_02280 [Gemmatimonadota bacterium]|nr:hypothetical protein [Gemmatimonadota bacterium]
MQRYTGRFLTACPLRAFVLLALVLANACQVQNGGRGDMPTRDIKTVMEAHVDDLMALPGVAGVAIGALDDGTPCIKVMVVTQTDELSRRIPDRLEGHPVVIVESGAFRPMDDAQN